MAVRRVYYQSNINLVGVVSDTHLPTRARSLPRKLFEILADVQMIIHAGDLVDEQVLCELSAIAPVEAVAGNMDPLNLARKLGRIRLINVGEAMIGLLHGDLQDRKIEYNRIMELFKPVIPQAIVFGHLHEPIVRKIGQTLFFNPGSAVDPRRVARASCGKLKINGKLIAGEIFYL